MNNDNKTKRTEWNKLTAQEQWDYFCLLEDMCNDLRRVVQAVPECSQHGSDRIPHALDWIKVQAWRNNNGQQ